MGEDDRREHFRAPIELKVEYKKINTFFADYTKNISKGGTFIKTAKPLDIGTEFVFVLSLPTKTTTDGTDTQLKLRGKVIWVTTEAQAQVAQDPDRRTPGMGIRFLFQ